MVIYLPIITIIAALFAFLGLFALLLLRFAFGLFGATIVSAAAALLLPLFAATAATGREELQSNLAINVNSFECTHSPSALCARQHKEIAKGINRGRERWWGATVFASACKRRRFNMNECIFTPTSIAMQS